MADILCLDASFLVKLVVMEPGTKEAQQVAIDAARDHVELIVPSFAFAEALSVLRRRAHQRLLPSQMAQDAMEVLLSLQLEEVSGVEVYRKAWGIASELGLPVVYGAAYLAVAEMRGATFWTADEALYRKVSDRGYARLLRGCSGE